MRIVQVRNENGYTTLLLPDDVIEWLALRIGWILMVFKGHRVITGEWCGRIDE